MISSSCALQQLERIMGLVGFPRGKDSGSYVAEMRKAVESSRTEQIAEQVISGLLRSCKRCPSVSDIYEMVFEENNRGLTQKAPKCKLCDGNGAVTVWLLVTYNGRSFDVKEQEVLKDFGYEKAQEFGKNLRWDDGMITAEKPFLGNNQQIVTGARACSCRKGLAIVAR